MRGGLFTISNLGRRVGKGWLGFAISVPAMKGFPAATVGKAWHFVGCLEGVAGRVVYDFKFGMEHREGLVRVGHFGSSYEGVSSRVG